MPDKSKSKQKTIILDPTLGHVQPQAVESEKVVLGALMIDRDAFTIVSELLHPETFYEPRHQKIYHAIQSLNFEERPVDIMTVVEQLKRENTLEDIGGHVYIAELSSRVATSAHIEFHARVLQQKYLARQLISFAGKVGGAAIDESTDIDELMQKAEGMLFELSQKNLKQEYTQIDPVINQALRIITESAKNKGGLTGIPSGFHKLDKKNSGWQPSDLVIIAGRPGMGKTSFALSLAKNAAVDFNVPTAFFSLEMNNVQLVNRLISNVCEIDGNHILNGDLSDMEWKRLDSNITKLQGAPLYLDDTPQLSVFELRTKARRLVREKGVKLIMIDYLQLMNASGMRYNNRQEEVSTISRSLKALAKELNVPVLALSQLSRDLEKREGEDGKIPQLSDLRESGAIEQDADMVIFVHRPEYYGILKGKENNDLNGVAQIIIAKHRKGSTGKVDLMFKKEYTRFANLEDRIVGKSSNEDGIVVSKVNTSNIQDDGVWDVSFPDMDLDY